MEARWRSPEFFLSPDTSSDLSGFPEPQACWLSLSQKFCSKQLELHLPQHNSEPFHGKPLMSIFLYKASDGYYHW